MKRTFGEFSQSQANGNENQQQDQLLGGLYGLEAKRRKIDQQRIGDFIVKGLEAVHFKIVDNQAEVEDDSLGNYFAPKFLYWVSPTKYVQTQFKMTQKVPVYILVSYQSNLDAF